ncbi:MAG TPA: hypothetical protein DD670_18715 [Planctomycetaceae bacterium]|nr:hypothetical protein [Planctomycetaceae bacterium]
MIRVRCPGCGSHLNAKKKLAGQTRKCPKCGSPVTIPDVQPDERKPATKPAARPAVRSTAEPTVIVYANPAETNLTAKPRLDRLVRTNRYLICDKTMVVAMWRNDGRGWMVRGAGGFMSARRNSENLMPEGFFVLVELDMAETDEGIRLAAINSYQLSSRFAMTKLDKGDDDIVQAVTEPGCLNREQKFAVRQALQDQFMREVWRGSDEVVDYLSNFDFRSHTSRKSETQ